MKTDIWEGVRLLRSSGRSAAPQPRAVSRLRSLLRGPGTTSRNLAPCMFSNSPQADPRVATAWRCQVSALPPQGKSFPALGASLPMRLSAARRMPSTVERPRKWGLEPTTPGSPRSHELLAQSSPHHSDSLLRRELRRRDLGSTIHLQRAGPRRIAFRTQTRGRALWRQHQRPEPLALPATTL